MSKAGVLAGLVTTNAPADGSPTIKRKGYHWFEYGANGGPANLNCCSVETIAVLTPDLHVAGEVAGVFDGDVIIGDGIIEDERVDSVKTTGDDNNYFNYVGFNPGNNDSGLAEVYFPECQWNNYTGPRLGNVLASPHFDFTDVSWAKTGTLTIVTDQPGLDGETDFSCVLTDIGASFSQVTKSSALNSIPQNTEQFVGVITLHKEVSAPHFSRFTLSNTAGAGLSIAVIFNAETGAGYIASTSSGTDTALEIRDNGDWWEVYLETTASGSSGNEGAWQIVPSFNLDGSENSDSSATGGIRVANVTVYIVQDIGNVRGGAQDPRKGVGQTAVIDQSRILIDASNHSDTEGGYYFEFRPLFSHAEISTDIEILSLNDATGLLYYDHSTQLLTSTDGTNTATVPLTLTKETKYRLAVAFGSSLMRVGVNGVWGAEVPYDGAFAGGSDFTICRNPLNVNYWRELRGYQIAYLDAVDELFLLMTLCVSPP